MYGCERDHKESSAGKNWCFWAVVLVKTLESPLDYKEIKPVNPKGNQSWIFIGRTDVEAEAPILWPLDAKNWLLRKDPDAGKDWKQEEKGQHRMRWFDGITISMDLSFEQAPGIADGQGSLLCFSPWGCKESDMTEQLNWLTDWHENISLFYYKDHNNFFKKETLGHKLLQHIWQISILPESICPYIFMKQVTSRGYQNHALCPVSSLICSCPGVPILSAKTSGFSLGLFPPCLKLTVHRNRMLMRSSS